MSYFSKSNLILSRVRCAVHQVMMDAVHHEWGMCWLSRSTTNYFARVSNGNRLFRMGTDNS